MKPLKLFNGASGLNTVVDPTRIQYIADAGVSDLAVAVNIDIDQTGRPGRRQGYTLAQSGDFHSLWCNGGDCYVGKTTSLFRVAQDLSLTGVRSSLSGDRLYFCDTPKGVYYSNTVQNGVLNGSASVAWPVETYIGADTNRVFSPAVLGKHLSLYRGRMFIAEGPVLWWSEPFMYGLFDKAKGFAQFDSDILMVAEVATGIYISTRTKTVFLGGTPGEFVQSTVCPYPAIEHTLAIDSVEGMEIGMQNPGLCRVWASPEGAILGTANGQVINLNKEKVIYDESPSNGAGVLRGYQFIHNMT